MIVISGISVGLPGRNSKVFSEDNFTRLLEGQNFIDVLTDDEKKEFLNKKLQTKNKGQTPEMQPITSINEVSQLAGLMGKLDINQEYGLDPVITDTMDITSKLALVAGLEAMKDAGISLVKSMDGPGHLRIDEQRETGIIFASSFPGFDSFAKEFKLLNNENYTFNRKLLFNLLVMANAQLAQLIKAKGPNTQINAACASTSQAIAIAEDWISSGRCKRIIVISADVATSEQLMSWLGSGFLVLKASSVEPTVETAALPFSKNRNGMILGMGAVGLVLEDHRFSKSHRMPHVLLIGSHIANAAYHASSIDFTHLSEELEYFISEIEKKLLVNRSEMTSNLIYMSHETYTAAHGGAAKAEITALEHVFGSLTREILICNTKGFTGHPMGVNIEDVASVYALRSGKVPPIANLTDPDPDLGELQYSSGGDHTRKYVLRYAGGFGSQVVFLFFAKMDMK